MFWLRNKKNKFCYTILTKGLDASLFFSFYIILSGQTSVYIDTIKSDTDSLTENPETSVEVSMDQNTEDQNTEEDDITGESKKNKQLDRSKYGKFIIHFGKFVL